MRCLHWHWPSGGDKSDDWHWPTGGDKSDAGNVFPDFDVLLTEHLSIILVIKQRKAQALVL